MKSEDASTEIHNDRNAFQSDLVRASKCSDASAFAELVRLNKGRAFRIAYNITRNREDAEDAVQESFLRAYEKLSGFEERASFSTWITTIVFNVALGILRRRSGRFEELPVETTNTDQQHFDLPDRAMNPEEACLNSELRKRIGLCLQQMKSNRQVFVLRDIQGFSTSETAQALNLTPSAVKAKLLRARRLAKKKLWMMRTRVGTSSDEVKRCVPLTVYRPSRRLKPSSTERLLSAARDQVTCPLSAIGT